MGKFKVRAANKKANRVRKPKMHTCRDWRRLHVYMCYALPEIDISPMTALRKIGAYAFYECARLTSADFSNQLDGTMQGITDSTVR